MLCLDLPLQTTDDSLPPRWLADAGVSDSPVAVGLLASCVYSLTHKDLSVLCLLSSHVPCGHALNRHLLVGGKFGLE